MKIRGWKRGGGVGGGGGRAKSAAADSHAFWLLSIHILSFISVCKHAVAVLVMKGNRFDCFCIIFCCEENNTSCQLWCWCSVGVQNNHLKSFCCWWKTLDSQFSYFVVLRIRKKKNLTLFVSAFMVFTIIWKCKVFTWHHVLVLQCEMFPQCLLALDDSIIHSSSHKGKVYVS